MTCLFGVKSLVLIRVGCIINVASLLGLKGGRGSAAYAASKAGVIGKLESYVLWMERILIIQRLHTSFSSRVG